MYQFWRIDVLSAPDRSDSTANATLRSLRDFGIESISRLSSRHVFFLSAAADEAAVRWIAADLLADPVTERFEVLPAGRTPDCPADSAAFEVHLRPGVMDPVAESARAAISEMGIDVAWVRTGQRYVLSPIPSDADRRRIARLLGNECVQEVIEGGRPAGAPPTPTAYAFRRRRIELRELDDAGLARLAREGHLFLSVDEMRAIQGHYRAQGREPTDLELETLAQTWSEHCVHKTLKSEVLYRGAPMPVGWVIDPPVPAAPNASARAANDPAEKTGGSMTHPTLPLDAQSGPHCGTYEATPALGTPPGETVEIHYANLLKDTIARATHELMSEGRGPVCLSVFKDNAGIIAFDDDYAIAFKAETHNRPSAIEPYGGAATGIGGCIRDVMGCGLGAKPIANTDVFCVAPPDWPADRVPRGVIHPKSVLRGIVAGVRDYGNRMGIPTVNGAVQFDPRYLGNPLVFCGCIGLIPRDKIEKAARPGDLIVVVGGRTGRDGIHGATFSSAELTDSHADEFSHAVQIGNAIEEKKCLDVILQARDNASGCLYTSITDCGAGGLSSAVGEMAVDTGAEVDLESVPLKYAGLRYDEIWISESQERMVLAVPPERFETLRTLAAAEGVDATAIGRFTDSGRLVVRYQGTVVGDLDLKFLHDGLPKQVAQAEWWPDENGETSKRQYVETDLVGRVSRPDGSSINDSAAQSVGSAVPTYGTAHAPAEREGGSMTHPTNPQSKIENPKSPRHELDLVAELKRRLSDPTIASKEWLIRQYDHEVQGRSVVKPLVGIRQDGPSDAAVIRPRLNSRRGIAIGCGLCPQLSDVDPYWMAVAAIDEAIRNVVCVGGDPSRTAILDNFCWPRTDDPRHMGALVRACQGCYDAAKAYGVPFISGKDSLNNEFALDPADVEMVNEMLRRSGQQTRRDERHPLRGSGQFCKVGHAHRFGQAMNSSATVGTAHPTDSPSPSQGEGRGEGDFIRNNRLAIPGTLLISAISLIDDVANCVTMDLKRPGSTLAYSLHNPYSLDPSMTETHRAIHRLRPQCSAIHDISDGGLLVAVAEMCIASGLGAEIDLGAFTDPAAGAWTWGNAAYIVEHADDWAPDADARALHRLGRVTAEPLLIVRQGDTVIARVAIDELRNAWQSPLCW